MPDAPMAHRRPPLPPGGAASGPTTPARTGAERAAIVTLPPEGRLALRLREADAARVHMAAGLRLDMPINTFVAHGDLIAMRLGPDEWMVTAPEAGLAALQKDLARDLASTFHVIVDVSHRHATFAVAGPAAAATLNAGCPLDLDARAFPPGTATRTLLAKAEIVLQRVHGEADAPPTFHLLCGRSFARYVQAYLAEAARDA